MSEDAPGASHRNLTQKKDENDNKKQDNEGEKRTDYKKQAFKTFPWLRDFDRSCFEAVGTHHIKILETLLSTFIKQVAESIKGCYGKPKRSAKLRTVVKETVIFLNMMYQDSKLDGFADNKDYKNYLNLMTDLMAMYLDLEIKASQTNEDSLKKIGSMMTTSLFVFLDQSEDHIIEAILKAKLITKRKGKTVIFGELCAPVLAKCLKDGKCFVGNEADYIRYLLAFKLWKMISKSAHRKIITPMAERKLNPSPQLIDSIKKMTNILPNMPMLDKKMTLFLMNDKDDQFKFLPAKEEFLKTCSISRSSFPSLSEKPIAFSDCLPDSISAVSEKEFKGKRLKESSFKENIWSSVLPSGTDAIGLSTDMQKPRVPQLSINGIKSGTGNDEDSDDMEVIECPKPVKPVTVITLDADGDSETAPKESNHEKKKELKTKENELKKEHVEENKSKKEQKNICLKNKINKKFKNLKLGKKMPNSKKSNKLKDNVSTKEKDRIALSPEHAIVDSTSSNMGSPKYQVYEIHSNTGDDKLDTGSSESNEACSSLLRRSSADSVKISSTLQNSVPFSSYLDCVNSSNETNGRVLSSKEIRFSNSRSGPESDNTISNSSVADSSSPVTKALTFEEKTDAESNMSEKENLTYQPQPKTVKTSELNLHSSLNNSGKQDGTFARKNSVIQNWNGIAKSDQSNYSQIECKTLKVDKNEFKELAKSLKIVKSKDLIPEFNQEVAPRRSLLKSSYPSVNVVTSNDVSSTNRLKVLPQYVKISQEELKSLTNVRKRKTTESDQYYNGRTQHEIVDVVPEVVNEELVCATTELEISSTGNHRNSENTEQKLPQRRNVKSVPIICKPISEDPASRKKRKVVQNDKSEMDPVKNKQIDFPRRMPQLVDEKNIKPLNRPNQKSPSPPILIPANQEEPSILTDVNSVSGFINIGDGNPQNYNQDNIQVQNRLCDLFYGSENSNAISNFNMLSDDGQWSVGARDITLGEWRKGKDKDPMEDANPIPEEHNSGKDLDDYDLNNFDLPSDNFDLPIFNNDSTYWFGIKEGDENFLEGNLSYFKYAKNYPDVISVPCQRVPDCCCIRCSYIRKYFRIAPESRRDFFLQLRAAQLKRLREADWLKSQDDELLRRIEESFKTKKPEPEILTTDPKEKKSSLSSLPLKKRLKKLAEENPDTFENIPSTSSEKFPSYPIKPMISIAELAARNAEKALSYIPPKILEPNDKIGTVHSAEKEISYTPPKILEPVKQNYKIGTALPIYNAEEELNYIPPKILEPTKPNDKIGTVLPVQRRQEKKTKEENPTVKNLPAFEKLVEMHRTAYLAQVKGGKQSPSSVDMVKSFMSPMSMIQPEKNKSQIAQRYDYKISKPLLNEKTKEKISNEKNDNSTSTKDRKRHSSESKSRKRSMETSSRKYQRKEKSSRKSR